ncbi:SdpI family protein [Aquimarina sp. AU474]|uniref:SdpI family protein n=1 Tax=Aquimarina sp. AU474 TaxID=2108529 RepID=UPI000D69D5B5|nr:SdpI family protein [Aquimarina sp. AU474]
MKFQIRREIPFWILIASPILYLIFSWKNVPENIPVHYNIFGEPDKWDSKLNFLIMAIVLSLLTYLLLLSALYIDPKKRISEMGNKFHHLRFIMTSLIAMIFILMIYANINSLANFKNYLSILLGVLFILFGNYFRSLKPNYFIGIRTPWALENDIVWRRTHRFGSSLWFFGGCIIILVNLIPILQIMAWYSTMCIILMLILIPIIYSYSIYRKLES